MEESANLIQIQLNQELQVIYQFRLLYKIYDRIQVLLDPVSQKLLIPDWNDLWTNSIDRKGLTSSQNLWLGSNSDISWTEPTYKSYKFISAIWVVTLGYEALESKWNGIIKQITN